MFWRLGGYYPADASGGAQRPTIFEWDDGSNDDHLEGITVGTYEVTITDAHDCDIEESIYVPQPDVLETDLAVTDVSCYEASNGTIAVEVAGGIEPYVFNWSNGMTEPILVDLPTGDYTVTITDDNGCSEVLATTIDQPEALVVNSLTENNLCFGESLGVDPDRCGRGYRQSQLQLEYGQFQPVDR